MERNIPADKMAKKSRFLRWILLGSTAVSLPLIAGGILNLTVGEFLDFEGDTAQLMLLGIPIGGEILRTVIPRFWVTIPQVQILVTVNPYRNVFGGDSDPNVVYVTGEDGAAFPWEARSVKSNITGEVVTVEWKTEVPGKETLFLVEGSYQFRVDPRLAGRFVGIDEVTIRSGAIDLILAEINHILVNCDGDEGKGKVKNLNEQLYATFGLGTNKPNPQISDFELTYGIETIKVTTSSITLPDEVQNTRNAVDEARQVMMGVANLYGIRVDVLKQKMERGDISTEEYNEMLDRFFAASDNAKMNIQAFKINNPSAFAAAFAAAFGKK